MALEPKPFDIRCAPDAAYRSEGKADPTYVAAPGVEYDAYVRKAKDGAYVFSAPYEIGFLEVVVSAEFAEAWRREFAGRTLTTGERVAVYDQAAIKRREYD